MKRQRKPTPKTNPRPTLPVITIGYGGRHKINEDLHVVSTIVDGATSMSFTVQDGPTDKVLATVAKSITEFLSTFTKKA